MDSRNTGADFHDNHFNGIQALRGIAALFVIIEHVRFLNCGAFGVDIFFIISGFMIMFSTHKSTKHFLGKRLIRILPLYYLMTMGTYLLLLLFPAMFEQTKANPISLIKSLLFIPFDIGGGVLQPLMRIGWTVNCEIFFYLIFGIAMKISHRLRGLYCALILAVIVASAQVVALVFPGFSCVPLTFYGNPVMLEFVMGILLYYMVWGIYTAHARKPLPKLLLPSCLLAAAGLLTVLALTKHSVNILSFRRLLLWGVPALVIVLCFFLVDLFSKLPGALVKLGNMSFSVYLIHYYPVMLLDRKVFDFATCTPRSAVGVIISILLCLVISAVSWLIVEQKLSAWLKKKLLKSK